MKPLTQYEGEVIHALQDLLDIPHGDASGMVECRSFEIMQGFTGSVSAADIARKIFEKTC